MSSLSRIENFLEEKRYSAAAFIFVLCLLAGSLILSSSQEYSVKPVETPTAPAGLETIMAWIYPGTPACNASAELADGRKIDILKPEYFRIDSGGVLTFLDEENHGCNGFSAENVKLIKDHSKEQYVTVASADTQAMDAFLRRDILTGEHTKTLVEFVVQNEFEGVELDFEDFGGWNRNAYENYKTFVRNLGNALHAQNKKLMVDGPATSNIIEENWFVWRYGDFVNLPVDYVVVMAYDYQFDHGVGVPVSPPAWIESVITWTLSRFPDKSRLVIGLPSYGYYGTVGRNNQRIITYEEAKSLPGFETATRDEKSGEMTWRNGVNFYVYQDAESLGKKVDAVLKHGIRNISIWHLGGNNWFNE